MAMNPKSKKKVSAAASYALVNNQIQGETGSPWRAEQFEDSQPQV
jgi:hypothetical protein